MIFVSMKEAEKQRLEEEVTSILQSANNEELIEHYTKAIRSYDMFISEYCEKREYFKAFADRLFHEISKRMK